MVSAWPEIRQAVAGILLLARGDRRGLTCFDPTIDGFWRSFRAALATYPLYLILLLLRVTVGQWAHTGGVRILTLETIAYVISWTAFPLVMLRVTAWLGRGDRFFGFMVVYNWSQLPETALFSIIALAGGIGLLPEPAGGSFELAAAVAVIAFEWYLAALLLSIPFLPAALVVLIDLVLATTISRVTSGLY